MRKSAPTSEGAHDDGGVVTGERNPFDPVPREQIAAQVHKARRIYVHALGICVQITKREAGRLLQDATVPLSARIYRKTEALYIGEERS
jgi:hypothetical protein